MPNVERLGRESVRLHFDVGASDFVDKGRFAHVWVASDNDRARCGVDGRQTHHVLAHLLEIFECALLSLHDGAHAAECGALERFATVQRVAVLEQLGVVAADTVDQLAGNVHLTEGQLEVVAVVQHIDQVRVERVDIVEPREVGEDLSELLAVGRVRELNLAHVELADAHNVVAGVHHRRCLALRLREHHIDEVGCGGHGLDLLEVVHDHVEESSLPCDVAVH